MRKRHPLQLKSGLTLAAGRSGLIFGSEKILAKVTGSPGNSVLKKRFQQGLNFPPPRGHDPNGRTQSECWRWGDAVPWGCPCCFLILPHSPRKRGTEGVPQVPTGQEYPEAHLSSALSPKGSSSRGPTDVTLFRDGSIVREGHSVL